MAEQTSETKLPVNDQSSDRLARVVESLLDAQLKARCCGWTNKAAYSYRKFFICRPHFPTVLGAVLIPHNIIIMHVWGIYLPV